jgi:hypothetical protein
MTTGLKHIGDNQVDLQALSDLELKIGPVTVDLEIDLAEPEVTVAVYLLGVRIGGGKLDVQNSSLTIKGSITGFKAEITLSANFPKQLIEYKAEVCVPLGGCKDYTGSISL